MSTWFVNAKEQAKCQLWCSAQRDKSTNRYLSNWRKLSIRIRSAIDQQPTLEYPKANMPSSVRRTYAQAQHAHFHESAMSTGYTLGRTDLIAKKCNQQLCDQSRLTNWNQLQSHSLRTALWHAHTHAASSSSLFLYTLSPCVGTAPFARFSWLVLSFLLLLLFRSGKCN